MQLRPIDAADIDSLAAWLPSTAAAAGCDRWSTAEALRKAIDNKSVLVGGEAGAQSFIELERRAPRRDAACVRFLAVPPDRRRLGIGHRTALALEERLAASTKQMYVSIPARLGLALYFWLRLGYRPLTQRDWPAPPDDQPSVWMVRELR